MKKREFVHYRTGELELPNEDDLRWAIEHSEDAEILEGWQDGCREVIIPWSGGGLLSGQLRDDLYVSEDPKKPIPVGHCREIDRDFLIDYVASLARRGG